MESTPPSKPSWGKDAKDPVVATIAQQSTET